MAKIIARNAVIFADGYNLTGRLSQAALTMSSEAPDVTTFGEDNRLRLSGGIKDNEFTFSGFYDPSGSQIGERLAELLTGSTYYGFYYNTSASGAPGREFGGILSEYSAEATVEGAQTISATVSGSSPVYFVNVMLDSTGIVSGSATSASFDASGSSNDVYMFIHATGLNPALGQRVGACLQSAGSDFVFATAGSFQAGSGMWATACFGGPYTASRYRRIVYGPFGTGPFTTACMFVSCGSIPR